MPDRSRVRSRRRRLAICAGKQVLIRHVAGVAPVLRCGGCRCHRTPHADKSNDARRKRGAAQQRCTTSMSGHGTPLNATCRSRVVRLPGPIPATGPATIMKPIVRYLVAVRSDMTFLPHSNQICGRCDCPYRPTCKWFCCQCFSGCVRSDTSIEELAGENA